MTSGESIRVMHPLFQTGEGGSIPTSPLQFSIYRINEQRALELNAEWHSRLPQLTSPPMGWFCYGAEYEGVLYAVAIWTNPQARKLPQHWLELRRFAIAPDAPKNTASRMLSVMIRLLRRERPRAERLISYQDVAVHQGTIYKAAGWRPVAGTTRPGQTWNISTRYQSPGQAPGVKVRWEYDL